MLKLLTGILISTMVFAGCASGGSSTGGASGTATAAAQGFGGEVTVTLIMEKGKLTKVEANGPMESQGIGSRALVSLPSQMMEKNSVEVDALAGATMTSRAVLEAAKAAAAQIK